MAAAYLKNRTPHKALKMETPFKMLHGEEADLSHLCVIGARAFVHTKDSRMLDAAAWEGKVYGYSEESKPYRVWNPKIQRVVESRNVTFIEIRPHLLPPPSKLSPLQNLVPPSWDIDDDTLNIDYISYDDLLRDVRDYIGVLDFTANAPANHGNASGVSADPQVQELVDQIRDLTRRDLFTPAVPSPGAVSPAEPLPGAVREPLSGGVSSPSEGGASQETEGLSPASMPATSKKGSRYAHQQGSSVTRYRGACPNKNNTDDNDINNNNHAALAERFQSSKLHKLRQLGRYINTDTPDTAHQLDAEAVPAEVAYTRTNTQPSCSGGGESDRVPNTFKETMGLPQAARWKIASDKEIGIMEKHGVFNLVPITSVPAGHKVVGTRWVFKIKADSTYKGQLIVQGVLQILGMSVTRDREKGTITISQKGYTEDVVQPYGLEERNPASNPGVGLELSLNQEEEKLLNEVEKRRYQFRIASFSDAN